MKVRELIDLLSVYDPGAEVQVATGIIDGAGIIHDKWEDFPALSVAPGYFGAVAITFKLGQF